MRRFLSLAGRRRTTTATVLAIALACVWVAGAAADAGNPILNTIRATATDNGNGTVTIYVRGQWNWISHNSDCNFDRAATGVGVIWNDKNGRTVGTNEVQRVALSGTTAGATFKLTFKNPSGTQSTSAFINSSDNAAALDAKLEAMPSIGAGNVSVTGGPGTTTPWNIEFTGALAETNVNAMTAGNKSGGLTVTISTPTPGVNGDAYNGWKVTNGTVTAYVGYKNATATGGGVDRMAHPVDRGNVPEGYIVAGTDYPAGQQFVDPASNNPNDYLQWKGGCGREPLSAVASKGVHPEKTGRNCATDPASTICAGHPWGSWGYEKNAGFGYSHTYLKTLPDGSSGLPTQVCVNFYDVHGGGAAGTSSFQLVKGASEITVDGNGDNSIETNAFNVNLGANCVSTSGSTLVTNATDSTAVGGTIKDVATLSGIPNGTGGTLVFKAFKRTGNTADCSGTADFTSTAITVNGPGNYESDDNGEIFTPGSAGTYDWLVSYSGDPGNLVLGTTSTCGDQTGGNDETSDVGKASPGLTTDARIGGNSTVLLSSLTASDLTDTASLTGGASPTGTLTYHLYRGTTCVVANEVAGSPVTKTVNGNGSYTSPAINVSVQGLYRWVVSYGGDGNNNTTAGSCGDNHEDLKVINPSILVTKTPHSQRVVSGGTASWTITVTNNSSVSGGLTAADLTLTNVHVTDAQAPNCAKTAAQIAAIQPPDGLGSSTFAPGDSAHYTCTLANITAALDNVVEACGTALTTDDTCDDDAATLDDRTGSVVLEDLSSKQNFIPNDSATISGAVNPNGNMTFKLYKGTCVAAHLVKNFGSFAVNNGTASTNNSTDLRALLDASILGSNEAIDGTYNWLITYTGDTNNNGDISPGLCGAENFSIDNDGSFGN